MAYRDEVLADNPIHYWRLEETSGSTVADEVGSNDGTVYGANLDVSGPDNLGSAAKFDGTDDWIDTGYIPSDSDLGGGGAVEYWAYFRQDDSYAVGSWGDPRLYLGANNSGEIQAGYGSSFQAGGTMPLNEWVHLAMRYSGSRVYVYLNASEVTLFNTSFSGSNSNTFGIGQVNDNGRWLDGFVDEVAIYDYDLSASRIQAHYDAAFTSGPGTPVWRTGSGWLRTTAGILRPRS